MTPGSALYIGTVMHRRLRPMHALRYRIFWLLLDLGEIDGLDRTLRLFSRNRFNVISFHDADHGHVKDRPLREQIDHKLATAGIDIAGGTVRLLCMPRLLGYVFNPLSAYFCYRADHRLAAVVYEVNNTFGQRHSYVLPVAEGQDGKIRQRCAKAFYVSPFMGMDMNYDFVVAPPGDGVAVRITGSDASGPLIVASLVGRSAALSDRTLMKLLLTHPAVTLKVIAAIHWHALRLLWKRVPLTIRPATGTIQRSFERRP